MHHFDTMIASWNGSIFRVTGPLCGQFTGHRWIPLTKASEAELWCTLMFSLICSWINAWVNNREAGDLRRHLDHYDVIVMAKKWAMMKSLTWQMVPWLLVSPGCQISLIIALLPFGVDFNILRSFSVEEWCVIQICSHVSVMTSPNGNIFGVTGPLWRESTGHRWIPLTKVSDAELWCFFICARTNGWANNRDAGDLRHHCAHYDVTVILRIKKKLTKVSSSRRQLQSHEYV